MKNKRGSVLIAGFLFAILLAGWLASDLSQSASAARAATLYNTSSRAFQLAEAGLDQTIRNLQTIGGEDDIYGASLGTGSFSINNPLTVLDTLLYEVNIIGTDGSIQRRIDAVLLVTPLSLFRYGAFGDEGVTFEGSAYIDSYDSRNGPYDAVTNSGGNGNIGTNSTDAGAVDINGSSHYIDGQISVGPNIVNPEDVVDGLNTSLISGDPPVISQSEFPLPTVNIPEGLTCTDLSLEGATTWTLNSPGPYCYSNLHVKGGAVLTSDGPVTIYLVESLNFEGDSQIGVLNDPTQFLILMESGSSVNISGSIAGNAELYAAMYGPDAEIKIAGNADIYGSIIGNDVTLSGDVRLHYDEALADINILSNEGEVEIISWRDNE